MAEQVALLRGINLGKRRVKMEDLAACFAALGFAGARTLLASGNVLFEARPGAGLAARLEAGLAARLGFPVGVVLRSRAELARMVAARPFGDLVEDDDTKLYVTFLAGPVGETLALPCRVPGDFEVVRVTAGEVFHVAHRQASGRFGPGGEAIGKHFEKRTLWTQRNWNTVQKAAG